MKTAIHGFTTLTDEQWITATRRYYASFVVFYALFGLALFFAPDRYWTGPTYDALFELLPRTAYAATFIMTGTVTAWAIVALNIKIFRVALISMVLISAFWTAGSALASALGSDGFAIGTSLLWGLQLALHLNVSFIGKKLAVYRGA